MSFIARLFYDPAGANVKDFFDALRERCLAMINDEGIPLANVAQLRQ